MHTLYLVATLITAFPVFIVGIQFFSCLIENLDLSKSLFSKKETDICYLFNDSDFQEIKKQTSLLEQPESPYRSSPSKTTLELNEKIHCPCGQEIKIRAIVEKNGN